MFRIVASIAIATLAPQFIGSTNFLYGALYNQASIIAGGLSGLVASGGSLKGALQGAVMAGVMGAVGDNFPGAIENTVAHAAVGCGSAVADGGSCGAGALSGGFSAAAANANFIQASWGPVGGAMVSAVIGGTASMLGGGKFQNGAMTGAFGYLFNHEDHIGETVEIDDPDDGMLSMGSNKPDLIDDGFKPLTIEPKGGSGPMPRGLGQNPFAGKTAKEIDQILKSRGFTTSGNDPITGRGGYVNPANGRSYHIDPKIYNKYKEPNHVDVNRLRTYKGPLVKRKYNYEEDK